MSKYEQFFREADTDNDGYLSLDELTAALRNRGYQGSDKRIKAMFESIDDSGDRKISLDEYMGAMGEIPIEDHKSAILRRVFHQFDKNGDGQIDRAELDSAFRELGKYMTKEELDRLMKLVDTDESGTLSYEEFIFKAFGQTP